jgi:hypothetical protein
MMNYIIYRIQYFNMNKSLINYNKTNYVEITSTEKKILTYNVKEKLCIKYLGVYTLI